MVDFDGKPFTGMKEEPYLLACHPDHQEELLSIVKEGMQKGLAPSISLLD